MTRFYRKIKNLLKAKSQGRLQAPNIYYNYLAYQSLYLTGCIHASHTHSSWLDREQTQQKKTREKSSFSQWIHQEKWLPPPPQLPQLWQPGGKLTNSQTAHYHLNVTYIKCMTKFLFRFDIYLNNSAWTVDIYCGELPLSLILNCSTFSLSHLSV